MKYKEHCKECEEKLGKDWSVVHRWLDRHAKKFFPWMGHRAIDHHEEGIERIKKMWGDEAAEAARLHILSDFQEYYRLDGRVPTKKEVCELYGIDLEEN
jgi:DNA-binding GntR family transcriptional regulator